MGQNFIGPSELSVIADKMGIISPHEVKTAIPEIPFESSFLKKISKDFILITIIAFIAAIPLCWYWVNSWLSSFEVKMELSVFTFVIPFIVTLLLAILTIGFIVWKTASQSPAESLRSE